MRYLLDTNTVIYLFKGHGQVSKRLLAVSAADVALPTLVLYELETGVAKSANPSKHARHLKALLDVVSLVPFGESEARAAAMVRARLESRGTPIGPMDTLIAGVALANRAVLVTRNVREFGRIEGLAIEDWYA